MNITISFDEYSRILTLNHDLKNRINELEKLVLKQRTVIRKLVDKEYE